MKEIRRLRRRIRILRFLSKLFATVFLLSVVLFFAVLFISRLKDYLVSAAILMGAAFVVLILWVALRPVARAEKQYKRRYFTQMIDPLLQSEYTDLAVDPEQGIARTEIEELSVVDTGTPSCYQSEDLLTFRRDGVQLRQADVKAVYEWEDSDGTKERDTKFEGRWMIFTFPRSFRGEVSVYQGDHEKQKNSIRLMDEPFLERYRSGNINFNDYRDRSRYKQIVSGNYRVPVPTGDEGFDRLYTVYAWDPEEARSVLTPAVLQTIRAVSGKILRLYADAEGTPKLSFCFKGSALHIGIDGVAIRGDGSLFEPIDPIHPLDETAARAKFTREIGSVEEIFDCVAALRGESGCFLEEGAVAQTPPSAVREDRPKQEYWQLSRDLFGSSVSAAEEITEKTRLRSLALFLLALWANLPVFALAPPLVSLCCLPAAVLACLVFLWLKKEVDGGDELSILRHRFVREELYTRGQSDDAAVEASAAYRFDRYLESEWKKALKTRSLYMLVFLVAQLTFIGRAAVPVWALEGFLLLFFLIWLGGMRLHLRLKRKLFRNGQLSEAVARGKALLPEGGVRGGENHVEEMITCFARDDSLMLFPQFQNVKLQLTPSARMSRPAGIVLWVLAGVFGLLIFVISFMDLTMMILFCVLFFVFSLFILLVRTKLKGVRKEESEQSRRILRQELQSDQVLLVKDRIEHVDPDFKQILLQNAGLYTYSFRYGDPMPDTEVETVRSPGLNRVLCLFVPKDRYPLL